MRSTWYGYTNSDGLKALAHREQKNTSSHGIGLWLDRSWVLWEGTYGAGIRQYDLSPNPFRAMPYRDKFYADLRRELGLDPLENRSTLLRPENRLDSYLFRYTIAGSELWYSVGVANIEQLDGSTGRIINHPLPTPFPDIRGDYIPYPLTTDPEGEVWTIHHSIAWRHSKDTNSWLRFPHSIPNQETSGILQFTVDERALWLATQQKGLWRMDRKTGQLKQFAHRPGDPRSLSTNSLFCLSDGPDDPNRLWVGTFGAGMCAFDKLTGRFRWLSVADGLPNNVIYSVIPDGQGYLWMGTNKGLCRMNRQTFAMTSFTRSDGLLADEFNRFHWLQLPGGRVIMGGLEGIAPFDPDEVKQDTFNPPVELTKIRVNNKPIDPVVTDSLPAQAVRKIVLDPDQNSIIAEFAALQFNQPRPGRRTSKIRYRYRLMELEEDWTETDRPVATYTNLPSGKYHLLMNASNTSGQWSIHVRELKFRIRRPIWAQGWAYRKLHEPDDQLHLSTIDRNAHQLLGLVNQLLDLSKLEAGALPVVERRGNLKQFVAQTVESFQELALTKDIELTFSPENLADEYWFDVDKLESILNNLLANALKYGQEGQVAVTLLEATTAGVEIDVADTGPGIAADQLHRIFDRYYQVEKAVISGESALGEPTPGPNSPGMGLGLSLMQELVDLQAGKIAVTSEVGDGTAFVVSLPYRPVETQPALSPVSNGKEKMSTLDLSTDDEQPLVLVVEDHDELAQYIAQSLPTDYRILRAADGQQGWEMALAELPDLVLSDVMMPVMDGYALCQKLKTDLRTSHIPVLLLTAKVSPDNRLAGLELGADDYLAKPFRVDELRLRIRNQLAQKRRVRDQLRAELTLPDYPEANELLAETTDPFLRQLYGLLEEQLDNPKFGVAQLLDPLGLSRPTLYRKLKALTDMSPAEVVRLYRLRRAKHFLRQGISATDTAYKVGFQTPSHFTKSFRAQYGATPSEFVRTESPGERN